MAGVVIHDWDARAAVEKAFSLMPLKVSVVIAEYLGKNRGDLARRFEEFSTMEERILGQVGGEVPLSQEEFREGEW